MSFSSTGTDDMRWNKAVSLLLLFHYSLCFVYRITSVSQQGEQARVSCRQPEKVQKFKIDPLRAN